MQLPYPKAIVHVDGDSFFASCEVASRPWLLGKPVVTGSERGIASAMTYEAKARGITRGMRMSEIRRICPEVVILPSDYHTYTLYSRRMYAIVRRYATVVQEYSIDECFADITQPLGRERQPYEKIAEHIKRDLDRELGITFSVGLAPTKVLAKVASKWSKPSGLTFIPFQNISEFLRNVRVGNIWGIGPSSAMFLQKHDIVTAFDFVEKPAGWIRETMAKPYQEIWHELRGIAVMSVREEDKDDYTSMSCTRTFKPLPASQGRMTKPPSRDASYIFSHLSKNIEHVCEKARRHHLRSREIYFFIKTQDFRYCGTKVSLAQPTSTPEEILRAVRPYFDMLFKHTEQYRATGITLRALIPDNEKQFNLFGESQPLEKMRSIHDVIDDLSHTFGHDLMYLGSSLQAEHGITEKRLYIPSLGKAR